MLYRPLALLHFGAVVLGNLIARQAPGPTVSPYLATFENLTVNDPPPTPYQGLDWTGAIVEKNGPPIFITDLQTDQGFQYIANSTLPNVIAFSVPTTGQTFTLHSAYVGIYLSTHQPVFVPALDGVLAFTGTKLDGTTVVETVEFTAQGPGIVFKIDGVVLFGKALLQEVMFSNLTDVTAVEVKIQSVVDPSPCNPLLIPFGLIASALPKGLALDSLAYNITTPAPVPSSASSIIASPTCTPPSGCTVPRFGQCGGIGWTGCTQCACPFACTPQNQFYSQCL